MVKKTEEEKQQEKSAGAILDYEVFMAMVDHIGHDKRGSTIYLRDADGNLIMEHKSHEVREVDASGNVQSRLEEFDEKIINDQTPFVADVFTQWKKSQGIEW